jgi:hypothetical protein
VTAGRERARLSLARTRLLPAFGAAFLLWCLSCAARTASPPGLRVAASQSFPLDTRKLWSFAVSGDSRDCGDVVMPRIAEALEKARDTPVAFYWHLGDFRSGIRFDRDYASAHPARSSEDLRTYRREAWNDFLANQIKPFNRAGIPVLLGIGTHEIVLGSRRDFRLRFGDYLPKPAGGSGPADESTAEDRVDYAFVANGVLFVYLDNAQLLSPTFTEDQLRWLAAVLGKAGKDPAIKAIVGAMHAALPGSTVAYHAMDVSCDGRAAGLRAYALFEGVRASGRHVYLFASHSHTYEEDIYAAGHPQAPLPGWVMGMAGSAQYAKPIRYGYLLCEVDSEGRILVAPQWLDRQSAEGDTRLVDYCFNLNIEPKPKEQSCKDR